MDGYQLLANAIVGQAAEDYFNLLSNFPTPPDTENVKPGKRELERFFKSPWYELLTNLDAEYLMQKLKEEARKMVLEFTVRKEKGSSRYYVCRVGDENVPLTQRYSTKKKALKKAAEMQGIGYKRYMQVRRRDGVDET